MKASVILLTLFSLFGLGAFSQSIQLLDVVQDKNNTVNAVVKADSKGGTVQFNRLYRSGCEGSYCIKWTFSKDISSLKDGDEFTVNLSCVNCNTPCGYKWTIATASGSNNALSINDYPDYAYNGNLNLVSTDAESFGIHDWYPGHTSHNYTFKYSEKKEAAMTSFFFTFADHRVYYVFQGGAVNDGQAINCHALLGLGKLVASLEIGAMEGYGWDWMDSTIGFALNHIEATTCLSSDYLTDLKDRMYKAPDTKIFYSEIQAYSASLETEVGYVL